MHRPAVRLVLLGVTGRRLGVAALSVTGFLGGCAADRPQPDRPDSGLTTVTEWRDGRARYLTDRPDYGGQAVAASALVFAPPVTLDEPPIDLDRSARAPGAFFGYDEGSVEYYRLTVDDTQAFNGLAGGWGRGFGGRGSFGGYGGGWRDHYERQAVSERVGAIRR